MKKGAVFIVLLICAVNICCVSQNKVNSAAIIEMKNIEGQYINDKCMTSFVELIITKDGNEYKYEMTTSYKKQEGKISFSNNPEYFTLEGIKWASWYNDESHMELSVPEGVDVKIDDNTLFIQNYGNADNNYKIFDDIDDKYINLIKKYVTLPDGTIVDRRIPKDVTDMIFKRFEAIENGDIAAFRSTLGQMEDGVDFHYQLSLIFSFFGDFFDINPDEFEDIVASGREVLHTEIVPALFHGEYPLRNRNTGLSVKKIEYRDTGGLKVTVNNNKNEELEYDFIYY
jgi:hypothetical protein